MAPTARMVVATDIGMEMIREARRKHYAGKVGFLQSDLYRLPVKADTFDLVVLGFWFSHEPRQNYGTFFDTITRPLNSTGLIWLIDNNKTTEISDRHTMRTDRHGNNYRQRFLQNGTEFTILKNYFTETSLGEIFRERFNIRQLHYRQYYWSMVLSPR
jgi:ubiquinone/menaquinone biosynthesis C-methylase UbiE